MNPFNQILNQQNLELLDDVFFDHDSFWRDKFQMEDIKLKLLSSNLSPFYVIQHSTEEYSYLDNYKISDAPER